MGVGAVRVKRQVMDNSSTRRLGRGREVLLADQVLGVPRVGDLEEVPAAEAAPVVDGDGPQVLGGGDLPWAKDSPPPSAARSDGRVPFDYTPPQRHLAVALGDRCSGRR